jgi:hypothetical protein
MGQIDRQRYQVWEANLMAKDHYRQLLLANM